MTTDKPKLPDGWEWEPNLGGACSVRHYSILPTRTEVAHDYYVRVKRGRVEITGPSWESNFSVPLSVVLAVAEYQGQLP